jgi:hypothetical protein
MTASTMSSGPSQQEGFDLGQYCLVFDWGQIIHMASSISMVDYYVRLDLATQLKRGKEGPC